MTGLRPSKEEPGDHSRAVVPVQIFRIEDLDDETLSRIAAVRTRSRDENLESLIEE
jgi:hypothetical protein